MEWHLELLAETKEEAGHIPVFEGDPNFWQALDNSFSAENI